MRRQRANDGEMRAKSPLFSYSRLPLPTSYQLPTEGVPLSTAEGVKLIPTLTFAYNYKRLMKHSPTSLLILQMWLSRVCYYLQVLSYNARFNSSLSKHLEQENINSWKRIDASTPPSSVAAFQPTLLEQIWDLMVKKTEENTYIQTISTLMDAAIQSPSQQAFTWFSFSSGHPPQFLIL